MRIWVLPAALILALSPLAVVRPVRVSGESMLPALKPGQVRWLLRSWAAGDPERFQVWLVEGPDGPALKRVVGLPGEVLDQRRGDLWLNEARLDEPHVDFVERGDAGPWACGSGYLVLGDNRPESRDGRSWGPLPRGRFTGRLLGARTAP